MLNGIFECTFENDPYDVGELIVDVGETKKELVLKIVKRKMRFDSYVSVLFGNKEKITISKEKSRHWVNCGNDYFVVYPKRMGTPLVFERREEEE